MKILIIANHYAVCSARYAADAFKRLGHDVRHIGPAMGRHIWGLELPERYVWEPTPTVAFFDDPIEDLKSLAKDCESDLVIVMDSAPAILDAAQFSCPTVVWGVDNHVRDYRRDHFAHYFLAHRDVSVMPWRGADMTHLPCAYDPTVFTPSAIPWAEREYDVAMIGVMYPQRWEAVKALREAGLKVIAGTGLVYENMALAYQNARISLCLSAVGDVGQRVFESAACGCVVLRDDCPDFALLKPNGFALWDGEDIAGTVRGILADPSAEQHALAGQAWAKPHTWDARAQVIVDWATGRVGEGEPVPDPSPSDRARAR